MTRSPDTITQKISSKKTISFSHNFAHFRKSVLVASHLRTHFLIGCYTSIYTNAPQCYTPLPQQPPQSELVNTTKTVNNKSYHFPITMLPPKAATANAYSRFVAGITILKTPKTDNICYHFFNPHNSPLQGVVGGCKTTPAQHTSALQ